MWEDNKSIVWISSFEAQINYVKGIARDGGCDIRVTPGNCLKSMKPEKDDKTGGEQTSTILKRKVKHRNRKYQLMTFTYNL